MALTWGLKDRLRWISTVSLRHGSGDRRIRCNHTVVTNFDAANHNRPNPDLNFVSDLWDSSRARSYGDMLVHQKIRPDFTGKNIGAMAVLYEKARPNGRGRDRQIRAAPKI